MSLLQKNKDVSTAWKNLLPEEKEKYKQSADGMKFPNVNSLNEGQKSKLISVHRKNLLREVHVLALMSNEFQLLMSLQWVSYMSSGKQIMFLTFLQSHLKFCTKRNLLPKNSKI